MELLLEIKKGVKLGNINFIDTNKGTGYVKFEHDPWTFRSDKKTFDEAEAEKKPTEEVAKDGAAAAEAPAAEAPAAEAPAAEPVAAAE